jgi:integrase
MARKTLTDRLLRTLKTDAADTVVPGLAVRVGAAGQKTFVLIKRFPGRTNPTRRALGAYPAISLEQARQTARNWIEMIQRGVDPVIEVAAEREANRVHRQNTFGVIAESFLEKHAATRRTASSIGRLVRGKLISRWNHRPVNTIGKREVIEAIEDIIQKNGVASARQTLTYARRLFRWAAARDLIVSNPFTTIITADLLPPKVSRDRVLTDAELLLVLKATAAVDGIGYPTAQYTRFVLMTACRRGEAAEAVWAEFDLAQGTWLLPAARSKNANEHALPLPDVTIDLLTALPRFVGSDFVFSNTAGRRPISGFRADSS